MRSRNGREWFRASLEFDIEAPDEVAAKEKVRGLPEELVQRYDLDDKPIVKIEPVRETVQV